MSLKRSALIGLLLISTLFLLTGCGAHWRGCWH